MKCWKNTIGEKNNANNKIYCLTFKIEKIVLHNKLLKYKEYKKINYNKRHEYSQTLILNLERFFSE